RHEHDARRGVEAVDERLKHEPRQAVPAEQDAERDRDERREAEASDEVLRRERDVLEHIARAEQAVPQPREDRRWAAEEQGIDAACGPGSLPYDQHDGDRETADDDPLVALIEALRGALGN